MPDVGPSQGFMSRLGQNLPMAMNRLGAAMPGPMGQAAGITGALMRPRHKTPSNTNGGPTNPDVQGMQTTMQNGPNGMPPTGKSPFVNPNQGQIQPGQGMVRGPQKPFGNIQFGGPMSPNTGINGGGMPGGIMPPMMNGGGMGMPPQGMPPQLGPMMGGAGMGGGNNLWQNYMAQKPPMLG